MPTSTTAWLVWHTAAFAHAFRPGPEFGGVVIMVGAQRLGPAVRESPSLTLGASRHAVATGGSVLLSASSTPLAVILVWRLSPLVDD
jgi:hypothetical protein